MTLCLCARVARHVVVDESSRDHWVYARAYLLYAAASGLLSQAYTTLGLVFTCRLFERFVLNLPHHRLGSSLLLSISIWASCGRASLRRCRPRFVVRLRRFEWQLELHCAEILEIAQQLLFGKLIILRLRLAIQVRGAESVPHLARRTRPIYPFHNRLCTVGTHVLIYFG